MREYITFLGAYGKARLGSLPYCLQAVTGINQPDIERQTETQIDADGKRVVQTLYTGKSITVNGYIRAGSRAELFTLRQSLLRVLDCKTEGTLFYEVNGKCYQTEAIVTEPPEFLDPIQNILPFTVMFDAISVFWRAARTTSGYLYERTYGVPNILPSGTELYGKLRFPCMFGKRSTRKTLMNNGSMPCDFVCRIRGVSDSGIAPLAAQATGFQIVNETTGEQMTVLYDVALSETVTVDTAHFSITSDKVGNLLHKLAQNGDFFKLAVGQNTLSVRNFNTANNILVELSFCETYKEV